MKTYVQNNPNGISIVTCTGPAPVHPNQIDVTGRNDGPYDGKVYNPGTDKFSDPVPVATADDVTIAAIKAKGAAITPQDIVTLLTFKKIL